MLLFIASACPLTISAMGKLFKVVGSRALKIQQKFHVLFVDRIVVDKIPAFWLICLTETSFSSSKGAMYARYSLLKARVKTMHGKWISQTFFTDHSNQGRHTNWFSCHKRLCFHSSCINYLLFFEMYYIYKEQAYLAALKAANRLSQSNTIPDKTTWESFPHHVHFPTQQNYFQNDAFAERKPLPPIQCCFPQTPRDQAFFWMHNNIAFRGRGRGKNRYSYDV